MITICIVDCEQSERNTLRNALAWEESGFTLAGEAASESEALEIMRRNKIDIVLTDINMSDMQGLEFAKTIREQYPFCHIVIITKSQEFRIVREALRIKVDDFLLKPVNTEELSESLQRIKSKISTNSQSLSEETETAFWEKNVRQMMDFHNQINDLKNSHLIYLAIEYIEAHFTEPDLTLKKVAAAIFVNESYLSHKFKQEMKISMMEYITKKRIAESIHLLNTTNLKVYEISERVGFRASHYFGLCFKKQVGITINEYKKREK